MSNFWSEICRTEKIRKTSCFFEVLDHNFEPRKILKCQQCINFIYKCLILKVQLFNHCLLLVAELTGSKILLPLVAKTGLYSLQNLLLSKLTYYSLHNCLATYCKIHLIFGCKIHSSQN